jgi:hypothetical protein
MRRTDARHRPAVPHSLLTLALIAAMAAVQASSARSPQLGTS